MSIIRTIGLTSGRLLAGCAAALCGLLLLQRGAQAVQTDTIWIYRDGELVGISAVQDFEFYAPSEAEIDAANAELIAELDTADSYSGSATASAPSGLDQRAAAGHYGQRPLGPGLNDFRLHNEPDPTHWREVYAQYAGPGSYNFQLDKSGPRWNLDTNNFGRDGHVYGRSSAEYGETGMAPGSEAQEVYTRASRRRDQWDWRWRRGSMDGGTWQVDYQRYLTGIGAGVTQPRDVELDRVGVGFNMVECGLELNGQLSGGHYRSYAAELDNLFAQFKLDGSYGLTPSLSLEGGSTVKHINPRNQSGDFSSADANGALVWRAGDGLTLSATARVLDTSNSVTANTHSTGLGEYGATLQYRPSPRASLRAAWRRRGVDFERLKFEDPQIVVYADPAAETPSRTELAELREPASAAGNRYDLSGRFKLGPDLSAGLTYSKEDWNSLPASARLASGETIDSYLPSSRENASADLRFGLGRSSSLALRADLYRQSGVGALRTEQRRRLSASYGFPVGDCARGSLAVSRAENELRIESGAFDGGAESWNYAVSLSGEAAPGRYRLSYNRSSTRGYNGGDSDGLGLELSMADSPLYVSAWWRQRDGALDGFADMSDSGVTIGYRFLFHESNAPPQDAADSE